MRITLLSLTPVLRSHALDPCPVPSAVPWQRTQTLSLSGQGLPCSKLKITSIWQAQGHPPSKYFHLLRAEMDGNGLAFSSAAEEQGASLRGFSLLAPPGSSSSSRGVRVGESCSEGAGALPWGKRCEQGLGFSSGEGDKTGFPLDNRKTLN